MGSRLVEDVYDLPATESLAAVSRLKGKAATIGSRILKAKYIVPCRRYANHVYRACEARDESLTGYEDDCGGTREEWNAREERGRR